MSQRPPQTSELLSGQKNHRSAETAGVPSRGYIGSSREYKGVYRSYVGVRV